MTASLADDWRRACFNSVALKSMVYGRNLEKMSVAGHQENNKIIQTYREAMKTVIYLDFAGERQFLVFTL